VTVGPQNFVRETAVQTQQRDERGDRNGEESRKETCKEDGEEGSQEEMLIAGERNPSAFRCGS
jgi:hypothetical protein